MIESLTNSKVKQIKKLQQDRRYRYREGLFVVEGTRWLDEFGTNKADGLEAVFYTEAWLSYDTNQAVLAQIQTPRYLVSVDVMASMSDTVTPPGVLGLVHMPQRTLPDHASLLLILDGVKNPGNLGTMIRSATAVGVNALLLAPGCVDPFNPKVVRGSMGALLRLPIFQLGWEDIAHYLAKLGAKTWIATAEAEMVYTAVDWQQPAALIIGSEAHGPQQAVQNLDATGVTIPMQNDTESLNAAVAASVILFEAKRQRGQ